MKLTLKQADSVQQKINTDRHTAFNRFRFLLWMWREWPTFGKEVDLKFAQNDLCNTWELP